ncbi:acyltransferase [Nibribacter koreensis]|uniref:acyltransferase family protein n=1 Tax=Nibribacter koreensis TaxID=1084519 RepID=UPI0031EBA623
MNRNLTISCVQDKKFKKDLEALRGLVAIIVVVHHVFVYDFYLDPYFSPERILFMDTLGHFAVLIFFVLSGYVIGLSSERLIKWELIKLYLRKRFIRLYPIYLISLCFALIVSNKTYGLVTIIHNVLFTQVWFDKIIWENNPLWSLHYEVIFYIIFIPISLFNIKPVLVFFITIIVSFLSFFYVDYIGFPALTSYSVGFTFWSAGFLLSFYSKGQKIDIKYTKLICSIFLLISLSYFNVMTTIWNKIELFSFGYQLRHHNVYWPKIMNKLVDFSYLPYAILILSWYIGFSLKFKKIIEYFLLFLPSLTFLYLYRNQHLISYFVIPGFLYIVSILFYFNRSAWVEKVSEMIINKSVLLGGISYGIYILHFPLLVLFSRIELFSGTVYSYIGRFVFFVITILFISYLAEKKIQPYVVRYFKN